MMTNMLSTIEIKEQITDLQRQLHLAELDRKIEETKQHLESMMEAKTRLENKHTTTFHTNDNFVQFMISVVRNEGALAKLWGGDELRIHMKNFYDEYRSWCNEQRKNATKERVFIQRLVDIGVDKKRPRINDMQKIGFSVLREGLRDKLNTYCNGNINW